MRKPFAVLFENKVFSKAPNTYQNSTLMDEAVQKDGDTYFIEDVLQTGRSWSIYVYDPIETFFREERIKDYHSISTNLEFAKRVIIDEHYPAFKEFWFEQGDYFDEEEGEWVSVNDGQYFPGGRYDLVEMIRYHRYSEALPELREIILHDDSKRMRKIALSATGVMDRMKADEIVNEALGIQTERYAIMDFTHYINCYSPSPLYIANLRKKFEEYYLDYDGDALARRWFRTIPQSIIMTCARIPSLEALMLLEEGIKHPYPHVEHNAKYALHRWIKMMKDMGNTDPKIEKKVLEMTKKYCFKDFESETWKYFKKTPSAGGW